MDKHQPIRMVLATTLARWMAQRPDLDTQMKVADASGLGQTTIGRVLNGKVSATIDILEALGLAFGRDPGELIRQDSAGINYEMDRYARLPDYEKARVEAFIKHVINEQEFRSSPTPHEPSELITKVEPSVTKQITRGKTSQSHATEPSGQPATKRVRRTRK
ncbi:helix-turn-helix domain-containing protein [Cupriavidus basilensis]|uniref:helix-turn-helix domain-containing protein n=1 Tax=Cupriavidus basilensis TaxID=68895 RepID=UPI0011854F79